MMMPSGVAEHIAASKPAEGEFAFTGPRGAVRSAGRTAPVASGTQDSLDERIARAFRHAGPRAIIGGALPFSRHQADHLWCAEGGSTMVHAAVGAGPIATTLRMNAAPSPRDYAGSVAKALELIRQDAAHQDGLRKIVLARTLAVSASDPISIAGLMSRLADDDSVTAFQVALPGNGPSPRHLVGATPELLIEKRGRAILSNPLAGSIRRCAGPAEDAQACGELARSDKDRREHAMVVEYILDQLSPWCRRLGSPEGTRLTSTRSMWHLHTRIVGELLDDSVPVPVLAAALHPTPAVCGLPCQRAADLISQLEPVARDFYAGAVGWCDNRGDGAWYVAIRCADICGREARLYAGAGIVEGSDPMIEAAETGSKFAAMLAALGLPADAALTD
ncbi:isochorismate synthase [Paracoccus aurantiacus]|uniref:isochorismate synthase n=1 Tax=Paracoccus aurantiacus TaxID=2599412 RepID=A0A5C6RVT9_9RHOB|nr:isochorismate synthase [Paracoccus aurantiacus]TXB65680.1 isochorismate synthase [Paracoccus aurantiacus]